jgi:hypothetical protein
LTLNPPKINSKSPSKYAKIIGNAKFYLDIAVVVLLPTMIGVARIHGRQRPAELGLVENWCFPHPLPPPFLLLPMMKMMKKRRRRRM